MYVHGDVVRLSALISVGYFTYLLIPIALSRLKLSVKLFVMVLVGGLLYVIWLFGVAPPRWGVIANWAPAVYLLLGYWLPGRLHPRPNERVERWLLAVDERLFALAGTVLLPAGRFARPLRTYLEAAYLLCYPLVPATFAVVYVLDGPDLANRADRFWSVVLLAVLPCYGVIPWLTTRPPRTVSTCKKVRPRTDTTYDMANEIGVVRRLNLFVLKHLSIQVNTLPSGHVAAAVASALAVGRVLPVAGIVVGAVGVSIAVASVVGRYHYAVDAVLGALMALLAFAVLT